MNWMEDIPSYFIEISVLLCFLQLLGVMQSDLCVKHQSNCQFNWSNDTYSTYRSENTLNKLPNLSYNYFDTIKYKLCFSLNKCNKYPYELNKYRRVFFRLGVSFQEKHSFWHHSSIFMFEECFKHDQTEKNDEMSKKKTKKFYVFISPNLHGVHVKNCFCFICFYLSIIGQNELQSFHICVKKILVHLQWNEIKLFCIVHFQWNQIK